MVIARLVFTEMAVMPAIFMKHFIAGQLLSDSHFKSPALASLTDGFLRTSATSSAVLALGEAAVLWQPRPGQR
jgi:hypothetical protein